MSTQPLSIRFAPTLLERLRREAGGAGTSPSTLAQRLIDEGLRMVEHPGIVFRDGPAGRRAALAAGPDVWEVAAVLRQQDERGEAALLAVAEVMGLSDRQVRTAVRYFAAHEDEIARRIQDNQRAAQEALTIWETQQRLLA